MRQVSKFTVHHQVYEELRRSVMSGIFQPGELVTIRDLAQRLGTSEMPIREALRRLIAERAFETLPNRTVRVPVLSIRRTKQLLDVRCALEGMAAGIAARNLSEVEIAKIERLNNEAVKALNAGQSAQYLQFNTQFHRQIYAGAKSEVLGPMIESLWLQYAPVMAATFAKLQIDGRHWNRTGGRHHEDIIAGLRDRDSAAVKRAIERDIVAPTRLQGFWEIFSDAAQPSVEGKSLTRRRLKRARAA
jgi:DNA-binding GntR family transcriptional regulator